MSGSYTSEMDERSDQQLLREYVGRGSEEAFTALVKRHTSLVYGTACRKLGDKSAAEEITQAVFVVLARKAAFLCHHENLSGWLHRTTLLECQQRIRADLRRKRREEIAMNVNEPQNDTSIAQEVDEALLELSEKDRQPLLMRFFEALSLRDVAVRLGIREDAAQKRVAKSLGLLERILRRRGRDIGSAALAVALAESAQAAPVYLATSAAQGAVATTGAATAVGLAFGKFMALTKTQVAAACVLAIVTPLLLETPQFHAVRQEAIDLQASLAFHEKRTARYSEMVRLLETETAKLALERKVILAGIKDKQSGSRPAPNLSRANLYRWSEASAYIRLPKDLLESVRLTSAKQTEMAKRYGIPAGLMPGEIERLDPIDGDGNISGALAEALALSDDDRAAVSGALQQIGAQFDAIAAQHTVVTNVMPPGIRFYVPSDYQLRTLLTREFPEEGQRLKQELVAALEAKLGRERAQVLMRQGYYSFSSAFQDFGARQRWLSAAPTADGMVTVARAQTADGIAIGSSVHTVKPKDVPESLRAFLPQSLFVNHE